MKIKLSSKILSLMMVAIMLIGAMPTMQFSAFAVGNSEYDTTDLIFTAKEIYDTAEPGIWGDKYGCSGYDEVNFSNKNQLEYVRLSSLGGAGTAEAYFHLFYTAHKVAPVIAIKYRTKTSGITMQIFSDSVNKKVAGANTTTFGITTNGEWNLVTVNLAEKISAYNGETANYLRLDFMNANPLPEGAYVDIAYIGFFDTVDAAKSYDAANFKGEIFIDPDSTYTASDKYYCSALDMINGMGEGTDTKYNARGGNSKTGVDSIQYNGTTFSNNLLVFSGWSVVDGGVSKYVWSVDYGKTWHDTGLYNRTSIFNASDAMINATQNTLGVTLKDATGAKTKGGYQGKVGSGVNCSGISVDLSGYKGKTVDVTFAAVPAGNTSTLCVLDFVEGVYVGEKSELAFSKVGYSNENSDVIENASVLLNGVDAYYNVGGDRNKYTVENQNTLVNYNLVTGGNSTVASITDRSGAAYIQNTMKVFVRTTAGKTYYASNYVAAPRPNIFRLGYYYYDVHMLDTDFVNSTTVSSQSALSVNKFTNYSKHHSTKPTVSGGVLSLTIANPLDTYVYASNLSYKAENYNAIQITIKSETSSSMDIYFDNTGKTTAPTTEGKFRNFIKNDGEWHTYTISTELWNNYTGTVNGLRFDFDGMEGTDVQIKDIKLLNITYDRIPLTLDRTMHTYSDKLHQEIHVVAYEDTTGIDAIGVITEIAANTVNKLIVKDKNGTHTTLDGVDWASAEYIGFDIKNVGVFGYILPFDGKSGGMTVTLSGGVYTITQECTPEGGTILSPMYDTSLDFRMGHRIYTDSNHTFDAFLKEAYCERNPLTAENIVIDTNETPRSKFKGYDAIKGAYYFTLSGAAGFSGPYYDTPNTHYQVSFGITGDDLDRSIYVMAHASSGNLESAALLDVNDMLLPVSLEVCKNFSEGEEPIYNCGDNTYGDTIFPVTVGANDDKYFTLLNLYQNWGKYPLKQISSIGYYVPYYHLSTGVTETNCIAHYSTRGRNFEMLPDFRSMSQPFWTGQPQHYNAGHHAFLRYEDSAGNVIGTEYTDVAIGSYGPTYADVTMDYITDDGKIRVELNHMEMPQTDENRGYYEIVYTVLDDVTISNFREDFSIYSFFGYSYYTYLGYLDSLNNCKVAEMIRPDGTSKDARYFTLGTYAPYFDVYYMESATSYGNLAFVIDSSEIIIGGQKSDVNFALKEAYQTVSLTLDIDGAVTLKAGDSIKINAVIMPWGGGWKDSNVVEFDPADYSVDVVEKKNTDGTTYKVYHVNNDNSVRKVRTELIANSGANMGSAVAVADCTVVASTFLPTVKTTNGSSAQFMLRGGFDAAAGDVNFTVLAKGFDSLNVPVIEELVDGEWVEYVVSSKDTPDKMGTSHEYDGYAVTYENGKYNYSFVTTITGTASRTFRVTVDEAETKGLEYALNSDGESLTVVGFNGLDTKSLVIPEEYAGLPVTGIESGAFRLETVKSIKIPASITYISNQNAFLGNFTGVTVEIDADNPVYTAKGNKITHKTTGETVWLGSRYGNVDGDTTISINDVILLREYLANYDFENGTTDITVASGADVNGDGEVNSADLTLLRQYFANYDYNTGTPGVALGRET